MAETQHRIVQALALANNAMKKLRAENDGLQGEISKLIKEKEDLKKENKDLKDKIESQSKLLSSSSSPSSSSSSSLPPPKTSKKKNSDKSINKINTIKERKLTPSMWSGSEQLNEYTHIEELHKNNDNTDIFNQNSINNDDNIILENEVIDEKEMFYNDSKNNINITNNNNLKISNSQNERPKLKNVAQVDLNSIDINSLVNSSSSVISPFQKTTQLNQQLQSNSLKLINNSEIITIINKSLNIRNNGDKLKINDINMIYIKGERKLKLHVSKGVVLLNDSLSSTKVAGKDFKNKEKLPPTEAIGFIIKNLTWNNVHASAQSLRFYPILIVSKVIVSFMDSMCASVISNCINISLLSPSSVIDSLIGKIELLIACFTSIIARCDNGVFYVHNLLLSLRNRIVGEIRENIEVIIYFCYLIHIKLLYLIYYLLS
jgi:cell division septum initiation protein DivIVA